MVPPAGFEPAISTLKGWRPRPLDDGDAKIEYTGNDAALFGAMTSLKNVDVRRRFDVDAAHRLILGGYPLYLADVRCGALKSAAHLRF